MTKGEKIIGIDVSTINSVVAVMDGNEVTRSFRMMKAIARPQCRHLAEFSPPAEGAASGHLASP